jgi:Ca2+-transporting ATPase
MGVGMPERRTATRMGREVRAPAGLNPFDTWAAKRAFRGLSSGEVAMRRERDGPNSVRTRHRRRQLGRLLGAWAQPLVPLLLLVAAGFALLGQRREAALVAAVTLAVLLVETLAALRAQRAIASLSKLSAPRALVWRDGEIRDLPAEELVVDDVVLLYSGARVPADVKLIEADRLIVDESLITGESQPIEYGVGAIEDAQLKAGTQVVRGGGVAVVTATGMSSTLGQLAQLTGDSEPKRTLVEREVRRIVRVLVVVGLIAAGLVIALAVTRGHPLRATLPQALTVLFTAAPAELPVLVVAALTLSAGALARRGTLLRQPSATETLATITLVCADKTGTLTENRIDLAAVVTASRVLEAPGGTDREAERVKRLGKLASEPAILGDTELGDPIDLALWRSSTYDWPEPIARFGFDGGRRLSSALVEVEGKLLLGVKGSAEAVIVRASSWRSGAGILPMDANQRSQALATAAQLASSGARVLAVGSRTISSPAEVSGGPSMLERDLIFEGLLAFADSLRDDVPEAVGDLLRDGVSITMVTGDGAATAESAARQAGLGGPVFIAAQTTGWTDHELADRVSRGCIIARARPEDKLRVVRAATAASEIVAVTGDGLNDVPALEASHLGVAMGRGGTDVARDAANVVLAQDSFTALASATLEARRFHTNLRKAVRYGLAVQLGLLGVLLATVGLGWPMPFGPARIVVLELLMGVEAAIAFAFQPPEVDEIRRRPRNPRMRILDGASAAGVLAGGLTLAAVTIGAYWLALRTPRAHGGDTVALAAALAAVAVLGIVMSWERRPVSPADLPQNLGLFGWALLVAVAAGLLFFDPQAGVALGVVPPPSHLALPVLGAGLLVPFWIEVVKMVRRAFQAVPR